MRRHASLTTAVAVVAVVCALGGCGPASRPTAVRHGQRITPTTATTATTSTTITTGTPVTTTTTVAATTTTAPARTALAAVTPEPALTEVARLNGNVPASATPGGRPVATVPGAWYGYPSILPVIATRRGWLKVREAQRPNGSTAWIPVADATVSTTRYYLVLNLATEHLRVFFNGRPILSFPAGIGTTTDPTVTGRFFIAMKAPPPNASYGPFVLVTSAHSDAIADWEGLGDAVIAIHGPIDAYDDQLIGTTGARISHGCIRLHISDLVQVADIPAGTPLRIIN